MIVHCLLAIALAVAPAVRDPNAKLGEDAFADGRWDEASDAFDAAYRNTGDAAFLYARAQAERRAGRCKLAIVLFEQFIASGPPAEAQAAAKQYVVECRALLPAEAPPPIPTEDPDPFVSTAPPEPPPRARPWHRDPLAAGLVAGGGAAMIVGAVLVPLAYRTASRAAGAADDRGYGEEFTKARRLELGGAIALSIGTALVIGGIVRWAVLARRPQRDVSTARTAAFSR